MSTAAELPELLKQLREQAGMSQSDLAARLCAITGTATVTRAEVSRWERGRRRPEAWLAALAVGLGVERAALEAAAERDRRRALPDARDMWAGQAAAEASAALRTGSVETDDEWTHVSELLRRTFLKRGIAAITLPTVGVGELQHIAAALEDSRRYADAALVEHFRRCIDEAAGLDRTVGAAASIPTVLGLVTAIDQTARDARPDVRRELQRTAALAAELLGWFYRDLGARQPAGYWRDRAMEWAQTAADSRMQGYVLLKKAQAAWDERDAVGMTTFVQAVQEGPWHLPPHVQAEAAQQAARAHAMLDQDVNAMEAEIEKARGLLTEAASPAGIGPHFNKALFELQVAICYSEAGRPGRALELYEANLTREAFSKRDFGYFLSLKGAAYAAAKDPDNAAVSALSALEIARATDSARTYREVLRVVGRLRGWEQRSAVQELRQAVLR
ncbi:helix-turn-helix domain-containing protein [Actinomadura violacea]|uniref:Helix-turn-helix transcriptional regulator n=1 Tax=Actinomadura violacea TaxID=2819934 RepID=A0ABS3RUA4_9ACTN|nr:helix-turn-helix transcriptional regulator [Actinomadura violacea]MBO2460346.1 helix-turn-helix transcriptional regulator [Actinomadura violacea]